MKSWSLIATSWGPAAIVWGEKGIQHVYLPEKNVTALRETLRAAAAREISLLKAPAEIQGAADKVVRHLQTGQEDFSDLVTDLTAASPFHREIYQAARAIPPGRLVTYAGLGALVGRPGSARAVGSAMARNPFPLIVPCHRVIASAGGMGGFSAPGGTLTKLKLLSVEMSRGAPDTAAWQQVVQWGTAFLAASDKEMAALIKSVGRCDLVPGRSGSVFATLVRSIVYQQLSGKAAATIFARVKALFPGEQFPTPAEVLAMPEERLRSAGLSGSKQRALKDLALKVDTGLIPHAPIIAALADEAVVDALTAVRGVGPWTVEMLLMFDHGRLDVWPVNDYGVRKGFAKVYRKRALPTPDALTKAGQKWRPFRSLAAWYFWRAVDTE